MEGTRHVVDACLDQKIPKIIYISSVAALGRQKGMTIADEETKWIESDLNSDYGESKYLAELEMFRGKEEGIDVSMIYPSVIVAPAICTTSMSPSSVSKCQITRSLFSLSLLNAGTYPPGMCSRTRAGTPSTSPAA